MLLLNRKYYKRLRQHIYLLVENTMNKQTKTKINQVTDTLAELIRNKQLTALEVDQICEAQQILLQITGD